MIKALKSVFIQVTIILNIVAQTDVEVRTEVEERKDNIPKSRNRYVLELKA